MKLKSILTAILFVTGGILYAQRTCATMEVYSNMIVKDSLFRSNRRTINFLNERFTLNSQRRMKLIDVTIPVVVHIVLKNNPHQIDMPQILSQLQVLNDDFASKNTDLTLVPDQFKHLISPNMQIRFSLAVRDPKGNATNGVQYRATTVATFNDNDNVKFTQLGGSDVWPSDQYLNIWVCDLSSGLLGYAQFPGGPSATDGVVIDYAAFGTSGTAAHPFNKGRTATHEVGHWLDLYHIWGDALQCKGNDKVDDTPNHAGPNNICPSFPSVTCNNGPNGELFMNYMDYVPDACMVMFSKGQSLRIQATLLNFRSGLFTSVGLIDPAISIREPSSLQLKSY